MKRIGILTSGGDCPGLNAVIRGAVKSCHHLGYDCVGFLKGYEGLYDPVQYVHLTPKNTAGILNRGGTILGSTNKGRFAATVGVQDRVEIAPDLIAGVKETVSQLGIDGLICVGGDGSLAVAQQFHENGIPVVGVPKTIDNDLSATAFTFGFDSAIECATDALDRLHTTAASHERIMVLEVMGRHAGWIALHSGIAGGGDVILIPEVKWNFDHVCHKIMHRESQGKKYTLIVVAEGAELPEGGLVGEKVNGQQMKLGGVGKAVVEQIETRLHREARLCVLGHLQRGGSPTTFDRVLATQFGAHAVRLIKEERFGEMICSQPPEMTSVPIMEAVNVLRQVDPNGPAVQAARALGISFGDRPADGCGLTAFDTVTDEDAFVSEEDSLDVQTTDSVTDAAPAVEATQVAEEVKATNKVESLEEPLTSEPATLEVVEAAEEPIVVEELSEEPAEEISPEEVLQTESVLEEVTESPVTETAEAEAVEEETPTAAEEEVAEQVLDLMVDVDEAANGAVEEFEAEEAVADEPATEVETTEVAQIEEEVVAEAEPAPVEVAEEAPKAATPPTLELDLAELVKQRLAAASAELEETEAEAAVEEVEEAVLTPVLETVAEPAEKAETKTDSLAPQAETPFEEDLLAEARTALEKALSD